MTACQNFEEDLISDSSERFGRSTQTLEYPDIFEILNNQKVWSESLRAWNKMLDDATLFSRREIGFYVYYRHSSNEYYFGEWSYGPFVPYTYGQPAYVNLGTPRFPLEVCAYIHCHTPDYTSEGRETGASTADENTAYKLKIPGVALDYSGNHVWYGYPYEDAGDPVPYTCGPRQRAPY